MKRKLTLEEISAIIKSEDECGVQNLLQYLMSDEYSQSGLDVIAEIVVEDGVEKIGEYEVVKGTTVKVKTSNE